MSCKLIIMRKAIHNLLIDLTKIYKIDRAKGLYPPNINISNNQTDEELICELKKMLDYMKYPYYSYLKKDK